MEAIFMDDAFKTTRIVDAFSSFIWNDYYIGCGDFELRFPMTTGALGGIEIGRYLSNKESERYMVVEGIEMRTSVEEGNTVTITGRSLESLLDRRIVIEQTALTGSLQDGIFRLISANLLSPTDSKRRCSKFFFRFSNDPAVVNEKIDLMIERGANLYDTIYDICQDHHIGFRCMPQEDGSIAIELYAGQNRSYAQSANPWVVFSPKYENIQETDMTMDTSNLRNVIYADSTYSDRVENADGEYEDVEKTIKVEIDDGYSGLDRREMYGYSNTTPTRINKADFGKPEDRVDIYQYARYQMVEFHQKEWDNDWEVYYYKSSHEAYNPSNPLYPPTRSDYEEWDWVMVDEYGYQQALIRAQQQIDAEYNAAVENEAKTAEAMIRDEASISLSERAVVSEFDGEVAPKFQYILNRDYNLGDVVQIVNEYGFQAVTRVIGVLYSEETGSGYMSRPQFQSDDKAVFEL